MHQVILYYNFSPIENVPLFCADQRRKCKALNLLGRVYVAKEGINGTLAGKDKDIEAYKEFLNSLPGFENTEYKADSCEYVPFVKLVVRIRPEIVALKAKTKIDLTKERGKHLSPKQWRKTLERGDDLTLLDVRNRYETDVGHFKGALLPDVENYYDFEGWLDKSNLDKAKKVLMYCTGGIRCEKFSLLMEKKGYKKVYQLHGGILNYKQKEGGAHFKGKCFVFDDRLTVPVEENQKNILTRCTIINSPCDKYLNCADPDCNKLFICSEEGAKKLEGCCSLECFKSKRRRPFDPENIYEPTRKWYTYSAQNS